MTIETNPPRERGHCEACGADLDGGGIWQHFYEEFQTKGYWLDAEGNYTVARRVLTPEEAEAVADEVASSYGATRTKGRWGTAIGITENDRIAAFACGSCHEMWDRDTGKLLGRKLEMPATNPRFGDQAA